jgi:transposase
VYEVTMRDGIREWVLVQGRSQRSAAARFGVSRDTVARLLDEPPEEAMRRYRRSAPRPAPVRARVLAHLDGWIQENVRLQRRAPKQRWTAHRMWQELTRMDIMVAESTVRQLVREQRQTAAPAYVPLAFAPGERAEFDFGHALVCLAGHEQSLPFLAGRLRYSGAMFLMVFPSERQDAFLLGQQQAFAFWGGVPRTCVYDNLKDAVARILMGHRRTEQHAFLHFRSVYGFEAVFANVRAGWEKGSVENLVGYARRTYLVPIPAAESLEALNAELLERCREDQQRTMAGRAVSIAALLEQEGSTLLPLPAHVPDVGLVREVRVRSTGRVRFEANDYSVPVRYAARLLTLKADPFRVRLFAGEEEVASHPRSYMRGQVLEDFRHYVPLLLEKPFAVPFASALRHGNLPPQWEGFRRELVARREDGNREFARILHLCLSHAVEEVGAALALAAASGSYSADAVRQLLHWADTPTTAPAPLDPARYPEYAQTQPRPDLAAYNRLLEAQRAAPGAPPVAALAEREVPR